MYNFLLRRFLLPAKCDTLLEHLLLPHVLWEIKQVPGVGTDISWLEGGEGVCHKPPVSSVTVLCDITELYTLALGVTAGQGSFFLVLVSLEFTLDTRVKLWQSELCIMWVLKAAKIQDTVEFCS